MNVASLFRLIFVSTLMVSCLVGADRVAVVVGDKAPEVERFAAAQLCDYLSKLFGIWTQPVTSLSKPASAVFLVGSPQTNGLITDNTAARTFRNLGEQGIVIERASLGSQAALIAGGGSPQATLWAVYELVERYWGVRYMLHGDVLPARRPFSLPEAHLRIEPLLPIRQWRVVNEFACGPASWGLADYRPVLDQLAKMKFNRLLVVLWPHQPFLDYEYSGIQRSSANMFFGYRFPITDDMPGRALFGNAKQFWNPDLPQNASYQEFTTTGIRHIRGLMAYGAGRGMKSVINVSPLEFPPEFAPVLSSSQKIHQLGELLIVPGDNTAIDDAKLMRFGFCAVGFCAARFVAKAAAANIPAIRRVFFMAPILQ